MFLNTVVTLPFVDTLRCMLFPIANISPTPSVSDTITNGRILAEPVFVNVGGFQNTFLTKICESLDYFRFYIGSTQRHPCIKHFIKHFCRNHFFGAT